MMFLAMQAFFGIVPGMNGGFGKKMESHHNENDNGGEADLKPEFGIQRNFGFLTGHDDSTDKITGSDS